jgi:Flp pilus assembly pilin Flp
MRRFAFEFREQEEGQALVEYGLILVIVSIAAVTVLAAIGVTINEDYFELVYAAFP